jgi:chemotaxis protein MotA
MDLATIGGLAGAIVIIMAVMIIDGGSPLELFAVPQAILLTLGGSLMASMITQPLDVVLKLPAFLKIAFFAKKEGVHEIIEQMTVMADKARREGLLALEEESKRIDDPFLRKGIMMVVDGIEPAQVRSIMELEIKSMVERHERGINFFNAGGGFAPTFGIVGTVMGLITVLKELSNPDKLAKSIASAFLATLWGLLSANLIWVPIAAKLQTRNHEEVSYRQMLLEGIISLQAGENPRLIKDKLNVFLAPNQREGDAKAKKGESKAEAKV